uniref:Protein phosphatase Slingshot homolog 1 n=1 Tax=Varanus komodoensis TaxID=61221 RepID=A0A8D2LT12_VARKO
MAIRKEWDASSSLGLPGTQWSHAHVLLTALFSCKYIRDLATAVASASQGGCQCLTRRCSWMSPLFSVAKNITGESVGDPGGQACEGHVCVLLQAVRLESARAHRIRYLLVVSAAEMERKNEVVLLGVDFPEEGLAGCTLGMVLPLWSDTQVFLDGDGGFSVTSGGQTRIFKPISVQTMSALQVLHKACSEAICNNYFPGGSALSWTEWYQKAVTSEQSCINEWLAMSDLESVRPSSSAVFSEQSMTERMIRAKLREVMATTDLENITSKEIRTELEQRVGCSLKDYKEFIDNEMLLIMAQMDRPSRIFDYLYLGSEWNAANLEELQKNRVTHILNVTREIDNFFPEHFTYMNVRLYDEENSQLLPYWKETYSFISSARDQGFQVLVHCKMGVSRSGSTVVAYAMKEYGWSLEQALRYVQERRPIVHPNPGFMRQLEFYQGILDASHPLDSPDGPKVSLQASEEPGTPDDSGAEEVQRHLATMRVPEKPAMLRRERINLYAIMRSISEMDSPEHISLPHTATEEEVWGHPCKQHSFHPAPGRVHKVVRHMECPVPFGRKPPLQHRLSVAQLADAALVVSRTKEFEEQADPESLHKLPTPSQPKSQPEENTAPHPLHSSRSRRVVRQASVDLEPSSG